MINTNSTIEYENNWDKMQDKICIIPDGNPKRDQIKTAIKKTIDVNRKQDLGYLGS